MVRARVWVSICVSITHTHLIKKERSIRGTYLHLALPSTLQMVMDGQLGITQRLLGATYLSHMGLEGVLN